MYFCLHEHIHNHIVPRARTRTLIQEGRVLIDHTSSISTEYSIQKMHGAVCPGRSRETRPRAYIHTYPSGSLASRRRMYGGTARTARARARATMNDRL